MNTEDFERLVAEALDGLPAFFRRKMDNLAIVVEDEPTQEQIKAAKVSNRWMLFGLYEGVPIPKRAYYNAAMPDRITIFRNNVERACGTDEEVRKMVAHILQHEVAHHFGISDEKMRNSGTY